MVMIILPSLVFIEDNMSGDQVLHVVLSHMSVLMHAVESRPAVLLSNEWHMRVRKCADDGIRSCDALLVALRERDIPANMPNKTVRRALRAMKRMFRSIARWSNNPSNMRLLRRMVLRMDASRVEMHGLSAVLHDILTTGDGR